MTTLDFFFDPGCPWTWMASRWVTEVAPRKGVPVRWRAYSLGIKNGEPEAGLPQQALRVVEAVWADHGDEPIGRLYTEIGTRFHLQRDRSLGAVAAGLEAAGLAPGYAAAAEEERWDEEIRGSMAEAIEQVGEDVAVPVMVFHDGARVAGLSGPVMSPAATGEAGMALWDAVAGLAWHPNVFEVKRSRTTGPLL